MSKVLSLIIPTYNMEKYLERCLSSLVVENEMMSSLEVIVVNDGSKDASSEIAHKFSDKYPDTFRVIDKQNGHYGSCVNAGLREVSGKYVKLLDSDDLFLNESFSNYLTFLKETDADMIISDSRTIMEDGTVRGVDHYSLSPDEDYDISILSKCMAESIPHQCIAWRSELLTGIGYSQTEGISYTDLEWVFRPLKNASSVKYFPEVVYIYQRGREGQTVSPEVHCKNMWMENKVVLGNAIFLKNIEQDIDDRKKSVLESLLSNNIIRIYFHYLINFPKNLSNKELVDFNNQLQGISESLYSNVESAKEKRKFMIIYFIHEWRKKKSRATLRFALFDFFNSLSKASWRLRNKFERC